MSYIILVECKNCGWEGCQEIPDGILISERECPICKCKELIRYSFEPKECPICKQEALAALAAQKALAAQAAFPTTIS